MHTVDSSHISAIKVLEHRAAPLGEALCCSYTSFLALLDTTSRAMGGNLPCAGAHHGNLTPPRISPSCIRRSTIIG